MAKLNVIYIRKFERTEYGSFNWDSELSVVLDSNGTVLSSVCTTDDGTETVNFEDIRSDFGIDINEGTLSVESNILTDMRFYKINTCMNFHQVSAYLCGEEDGDREVINFIPLSEEEFFEGTSLQKAA